MARPAGKMAFAMLPSLPSFLPGRLSVSRRPSTPASSAFHSHYATPLMRPAPTCSGPAPTWSESPLSPSFSTPACHLASVHSKGLTHSVTPLFSTLTKIRGRLRPSLEQAFLPVRAHRPPASLRQPAPIRSVARRPHQSRLAQTPVLHAPSSRLINHPPSRLPPSAISHFLFSTSRPATEGSPLSLLFPMHSAHFPSQQGVYPLTSLAHADKRASCLQVFNFQRPRIPPRPRNCPDQVFTSHQSQSPITSHRLSAGRRPLVAGRRSPDRWPPSLQRRKVMTPFPVNLLEKA